MASANEQEMRLELCGNVLCTAAVYWSRRESNKRIIGPQPNAVHGYGFTGRVMGPTNSFHIFLSGKKTAIRMRNSEL
jgi:hypothetical protein